MRFSTRSLGLWGALCLIGACSDPTPSKVPDSPAPAPKVETPEEKAKKLKASVTARVMQFVESKTGQAGMQVTVAGVEHVKVEALQKRIQQLQARKVKVDDNVTHLPARIEDQKTQLAEHQAKLKAEKFRMLKPQWEQVIQQNKANIKRGEEILQESKVLQVELAERIAHYEQGLSKPAAEVVLYVVKAEYPVAEAPAEAWFSLTTDLKGLAEEKRYPWVD